MLYATAASMKARYPESDLRQITDPDAAVIVDAPIEQALAGASAEIDGYLEGRYTLPLARVPAVLEKLACQMAMYNLQALRPLQDIEDARKRYEDAVSYLRRVAEGKVNLGISTTDQLAEPARD